MATEQQKQDAKDTVEDFRSQNPSGVWLNIDANRFANSLIARIDHPDLINTQIVNLCGPGAFVRFVAQDDPPAYVRMGLQLYRDGKTVLPGKGPLTGRVVTPGYDLRNYPVPQRSDLDPADWIMLASIRDSENIFFDFQDIGAGVAGITTPSTMQSWFEKAGYKEIINEANIWFTKDRQNAIRATNLRNRGYKVTLLISANMLFRVDPDKGAPDESFGHKVWRTVWGEDQQDVASLYPDHWVGLADDIKFLHAPGSVHGRVETKVHSWGHIMDVPRDASYPITEPQFLANYYGFIAVKY
jgi:hypothetical protein